MANTGNIENNFEESEFEWKITGFLSLADRKTYIQSPVFFFKRVSHYLHVWPKSCIKPGFSYIYLKRQESLENPVEYDIGLKNVDGSIEKLDNRVLEKDQFAIGTIYFKLSEMERKKMEEASLDVLTIICRMKCGRTNFHPSSALTRPKSMELIKLDTLADNLKDLMENKESCDTILRVQDKEYKAHRAILIARSPVFTAMFLHETSEKQDGIINITDCDPESFGEFLEFLYTGKLHDLSLQSVLHLYETSNKYNVEELKTFCWQYLVENLSVENVCDAVIIADKYNETNLMFAAQEFFNENLHEILDTSEWDTFVKNNYCLSKELLKGMSSKKRKIAH